MNEKEFNDLIKRIDDGDEWALGVIYKFYSKKIKSIAFTILSDVHYAEDVLQNVMITLWNKSSKFLNIHSPDSLIYRLTKNAAIDLYRHIKKNKKHLSLDKLQEDIGFDVAVEADYSKVEFLSIISSLDETEQEIIIKKIILGQTHKQIAEDLNLPEGTVKWKYQAILSKLKDKVSPTI